MSSARERGRARRPDAPRKAHQPIGRERRLERRYVALERDAVVGTRAHGHMPDSPQHPLTARPKPRQTIGAALMARVLLVVEALDRRRTRVLEPRDELAVATGRVVARTVN